MAPSPRDSPNLARPWPPGQAEIETFPIYDIARPRPRFDPERYRLRVRGAVEHYFALTWQEILALPRVEVRAHFHCVTGWSKTHLRWAGVPMAAVLERARPSPDCVQVMARGLEGYTTNVALEALRQDDVLLAYELGGVPLSPEHGAPLRLVVPSLYAWKSAKYLTALVFQREPAPGYWEERGYHLRGDPWREERYTRPKQDVRAVQSAERFSEVERPT